MPPDRLDFPDRASNLGKRATLFLVYSIQVLRAVFLLNPFKAQVIISFQPTDVYPIHSHLICTGAAFVERTTTLVGYVFSGAAGPYKQLTRPLNLLGWRDHLLIIDMLSVAHSIPKRAQPLSYYSYCA